MRLEMKKDIIYLDAKGNVIFDAGRRERFFLVSTYVSADKKHLLRWINWMGLSIKHGDDGKVISILSFRTLSRIIGDEDES